MATVTRENIGLLNDKITVTVSKEDYISSFEKALKNYSKNANIPGFRKGMVPAGMIKKMHGQPIFTDEVLRVVEKELTDYLTNEKLEIFAQPLPTADNDPSQLNMNQPGDYQFSFEVGLKPEFDVVDVSKEDFNKYKVIITEEMINDEIDRLRLRHGNMTEPETVTGDDNVLNVSFLAVDEAGNAVEGAAPKDNSLLVKYFGESFRPQLMGAKKDDSFTIDLASAFDEKEREWLIGDLGLDKNDPAATSQKFKMTVTKVGFVERAEFNEAFYQVALPGKEIKTEEEFKKAVEASIQEYWDKQSSNHLQHELYHVLLEKTNIELPAEFLKKWLQTGGENPKTPEQAEEEYPSFANQLKWTLITDKLVRENNIEVKPEELQEFAKEQLFSYMGNMGMGSIDEQPWVAEYVNKMMQDRRFVEDSYHRIQTQKMFDHAETLVTSKDKKVSVEEFTKELEKHQHHQH